MTKPEAIERDVEVLREFVGVYCRAKHKAPGGELCLACRSLLDYAIARRGKCPYDPKPACKDCRTHCYRPDERAKIREVMKFSGMRSLRTGGLGLLMRRLFRGKGALLHSRAAGGAQDTTPDR
jgi:hypothetical protein